MRAGQRQKLIGVVVRDGQCHGRMLNDLPLEAFEATPLQARVQPRRAGCRALGDAPLQQKLGVVGIVNAPPGRHRVQVASHLDALGLDSVVRGCVECALQCCLERRRPQTQPHIGQPRRCHIKASPCE